MLRALCEPDRVRRAPTRGALKFAPSWRMVRHGVGFHSNQATPCGGTAMKATRRTVSKLALGLLGATTFDATTYAQDLPPPFDKPGRVKIALVRYLSTGDFFQSYLSGVEAQAAALGVDLRVFDSRQDAALQANMVDQAIAFGVNGIIIQHGLAESLKIAVQRAVDAGTKVVAF